MEKNEFFEYTLTGIFLLWYIVIMQTTLTALAEPNRLRIVELLRDGPHSVGEITGRLSLGQPQVSKHLRVLSEAGLVRVRPMANQRFYQLQPKPFEELDQWLDTFRVTWEERLDTLEEYLQAEQGRQKRRKKKKSAEPNVRRSGLHAIPHR